MGIQVLNTMFGKDNYLTVSKLQASCFYYKYFKYYKLLNIITPDKMVNMVRTISLCKLASNTTSDLLNNN